MSVETDMDGARCRQRANPGGRRFHSCSLKEGARGAQQVAAAAEEAGQCGRGSGGGRQAAGARR